jgi:hypothetical protein
MSPATWWAAVYEDTAEAVAAWLAGNRLARSPSAANYFLNLVTDSTPIRHCREKFDIFLRTYSHHQVDYHLSGTVDTHV